MRYAYYDRATYESTQPLMKAISAVVITYNEAHNIRRCLESLQPVADELLVVDSFSTDETLEIAAQLGARTMQHPFEGHIQQKRYAIEQAQHDIIISLDADEELSDTLQQSILEAKKQWTHDCYFMNRMSNIGHQWIHHGGWYPDRKMRLFDRRKFSVGGINPHDKFIPAPSATTTRLKGDILHHTNADIQSRVQTINNFSTLAARAFYERGKKGSLIRVLAKPGLRFFSEYILRGGFLDGFYGFVIAKTSAQYVFLRESKLLELQRENKNASK
jgi:glycosyltransferase involved in cell wall biosynthesis